MLEVSEKAADVMKQLMEGREGPRSIRILMTEGGWKGAFLVMAFDAPRQDDHVATERGVTFLVEKNLFDRVQPINVGYVEGTLGSGFTVRSELTKGVTPEPLKCESLCEHC